MQSDVSGDLLKKFGYLTQDEYCALRGITRQAAANERCAGKGPRYVKRGRLVLYSEDAIREWIDFGTQ